MKLLVDAHRMLLFSAQAAVSVTPSPTDSDPEFGARVVPSELRGWLARLRLLEGVPFSYLVADSELLPKESIRFFYLDRAWTDAATQGALSAGSVTTSDRAQLVSLYPTIRGEVDEEERRVRLPGGEAVQQGPAGPVSGFVLRSRAVSGWPGLHVRAYDRELGGNDDATIPESDPRRIKLLRMERLAPAVLLVLFDGVPAVVHIEEPRQGVQFGVRPKATDDPNRIRATTKPRDASTALDVNSDPNDVVDVPFRAGAPGVLDIARLNQTLMAKPGTNMGSNVDSAEFALQMLRFPFRQVFGDPSIRGVGPVDAIFRPTLGLRELKQRFIEGLEP